MARLPQGNQTTVLSYFLSRRCGENRGQPVRFSYQQTSYNGGLSFQPSDSNFWDFSPSDTGVDWEFSPPQVGSGFTVKVNNADQRIPASTCTRGGG
jgi:hypothetical protein